jgi:hypothetical protein
LILKKKQGVYESLGNKPVTVFLMQIYTLYSM